MRLLKTTSYELFEEYDIPSPFPHYAILSHTWISPKDEITYQDMRKRRVDINNDVYKQKGWSKLRKYCDRAADDGWEWAWMDTCCIDKTNPADTQEAINAMFRWYRNAGICYAYLEDVDASQVVKAGGLSDLLHADLKPFTGAKWFERGWTLQELLAPHYLVFVDRAWCSIGTRENRATEIEQASGVEVRHLTTFKPTDFTSCSIAMRLSWASRRVTTVEEDETYSLLGVFGISMPLIYGEGRWRAFNRFQRELIAVYDDDSIFAWKVKDQPNELPHPQHEGNNSGWGILADSIKHFEHSSKIEAFGHHGYTFSMTNRGVEIKAKYWKRRDDYDILVCLNCGVKPDGHRGIHLRYNSGIYDRIHVGELCDIKKINDRDWEEEPAQRPLLIRAHNYSNPVTYSNLFILKHPLEIRIGAKYFMDFSSSADKKIHRLNEGPRSSSAQGLNGNERLVELRVEPNRIMFINIELEKEGSTSEFDVIIDLTENNFPFVGIMNRWEGEWERLGDPFPETLGTYKMLADYLHFSVPSPPMDQVATAKESEDIVGIHLLPKPPQKRSPHVLPQGAHPVQLREYMLNITVTQDCISGGDVSVQSARKRRRISEHTGAHVGA